MLDAALRDAEAMVGACKAASVQLFYGENWIFAPSIERAEQLGAASKGIALEMRGWESHSGSHASYARDWRHAGGGGAVHARAELGRRGERCASDDVGRVGARVGGGGRAGLRDGSRDV